MTNNLPVPGHGLTLAFCAALLLLCACGMVDDSADSVYDVKPWRALDDRDVSGLGRAIMRGAAGSWIHAETEHFTYHAATLQQLERVIREAEWSYSEVCRRLDLPLAEERGHLFVVEDGGDWARVMRAAGRRADGVALHVGREIFILRDEHMGTSYVDIPHEMVHYRLWQEYGRELPLWLEEGLAEYLGWETASAYQRRRHLELYREREPLASEHWIPWPELFARTSYPEEPARTAAFYRQTGALVEALAQDLPEEPLSSLVEQFIGEQRPFREVLQEEYGWPAAEVDAMKARVETKVRNSIEEDR